MVAGHRPLAKYNPSDNPAHAAGAESCLFMEVSLQVITLRVAVVTSSRAGWSHLRHLVAAFHDHPERDPILVAVAAMVDRDSAAAIAKVKPKATRSRIESPPWGGSHDMDMAASGGQAQQGFDQNSCGFFRSKNAVEEEHDSSLQEAGEDFNPTCGGD